MPSPQKRLRHSCDQERNLYNQLRRERVAVMKIGGFWIDPKDTDELQAAMGFQSILTENPKWTQSAQAAGCVAITAMLHLGGA